MKKTGYTQQKPLEGRGKKSFLKVSKAKKWKFQFESSTTRWKLENSSKIGSTKQQEHQEQRKGLPLPEDGETLSIFGLEAFYRWLEEPTLAIEP